MEYGYYRSGSALLSLLSVLDGIEEKEYCNRGNH